MNQFGALPKETVIEGQPHMLAYINPEEEKIIQEYRGNIPPIVGPNGVPAYWHGGSHISFSDIGNAISSGLSTAVNAGDMLLPAFRRTTDNDSSYSYCEMGLSIIME